jgi:hypothetical protein
MENGLEQKELDFLNELRKHENEWVALYGPDDNEIVIASGKDAETVAADARKKGFDDFSLLYLKSFSTGYLAFSDSRLREFTSNLAL